MSNDGNREYDFTLVLAGIDSVSDVEVNALFVAGCDDATVSVRSGRVYMTFSRTSPSLKDAILSAIADVSSASIGAEVLRIDSCNLVTQAEIARRSGRSRQVINQYILGTRGPGGFPPPACNICDEAPLWYWCEVSYWLWENNMVKEDVVREAEQIDMINSVLELRHQRKNRPLLADEIIQLLN
jgi:hypothetical protein